MEFLRVERHQPIMVSESQVEKVAENSRIDLDDEELTRFSEDFEEVLEMFSKLEEIDTDDVEPAFHPVKVEPEFREDEPVECLDREEVFRNTENEEEGKFKGPRV